MLDNVIFREQQQSARQYGAWQKLRELAIANAPGGELPKGYHEIEHAIPLPLPPIDDSDILDLSMELNAISLEDVPGDLDERGMERVPMADPGVEVRFNSLLSEARAHSSSRFLGHFQRFHIIRHQLGKAHMCAEKAHFQVSSPVYGRELNFI
jgi:hypothetical protein